MVLPTVRSLTSAYVSAALLAASAVNAGNCSAAGIAKPSIPEAQLLHLSALPVVGYQNGNTTLDFCNVTVTYTHPGKNDAIHTTVWLPLSSWNGRLQGSGGGGYAMRHDDSVLAEAVALDYSVVATDGGHTYLVSENSATWSLDASDHVNMALLDDFAYLALNEAAIIGKQISHSLYGHGPSQSYWNGCSTGGRQGLMLAQRYPTAYNGIMAAAPAINWPTFLVAEYWPQFVMNQLQTYPPTCVTDAITSAAVSACDSLDGVVDGVISAPGLCNFDPLSLVNKTITCNDTSVQITQSAALSVKLMWAGMRSSNGTFLWYGLERGAPLSMGSDGSLGATTCSSALNCTGSPFAISSDWIRRYILQDPAFDLTTLDHAELDSILARSIAEYDSIIGTDDPDLSAFKLAGGKMITWHGLADPLIFPKGTEHYYRRVQERDPAVRDFYRFFPAPGVHHCEGGNGPVPVDPLSQVVEWVEDGVVPETLLAQAADGRTRALCPWPLVSVYNSGDVMDERSYTCEEQRTWF
ncbi:putative feruloyl esterase [Aspergillus saccharolyticus JOP 1030-1]|uniref:Carboxylic ester hydrolase n=1 Tax=Aspergillus saccharolyticus JOP 1030-1 TaxID=1450539 RepID=A0A318Z2F2_9EURO|nr:feruloyl esterase B precursor [Aspergillus saccharolyticus JOP 1030-1]PYH40477.1 feruloyl esterase B precursor [Aspergillus saccharolyticus JOP 1030-1]